MTYVATELSELGITDYGIGVCTVDVDLTTGRVNPFAQFDDRLFENSVSRRIGDHDCRKFVSGCVDFLLQVSEVDVSVFVTLNDDNAHAGQDCRGGVGAVCARRNQTDLALNIATAQVITTDGHQAREFTLAARIRLNRDCFVAGEIAQPRLNGVDKFEVSLDVFCRCEWVNVAKLWPGNRLHLAGCIQLHGARTERNHASIKRVVVVG